MRFPRSGGVLLHPTSLPSRYGIGDLGEGAYAFIDFLVKAKQTVWQVLPLGPTGFGDSPYQSFSAFAGNPMLISPDKLVESGYLPARALDIVPDFPHGRVDFGSVIEYKGRLLKLAYQYFDSNADLSRRRVLESFSANQAQWLDDFSLFMALKEHHKENDGGAWNTWPKPVAQHLPDAIENWSARLAEEVAFQKFTQFLFYEQWLSLKDYANSKGIRIIGDVPIFVAFDSADVWSKPDLYFLDRDNAPIVVAGVPPDYFSETGQRWGNPLYRWDVMKQDNYAWWAERLRMVFTQVDIVRIDHFRGFEAYWEIPADEPTAVVGRWLKGPGAEFFEQMRQALGDLPIIAEDLGVITAEVTALRDRFEFPGMKILQFAFGGERNSAFLPHSFDKNCVVYTGTHDNETSAGWYDNASADERDHVRRYVARDGHDIVWDMIRLAYSSVADTAVVPMQDLMALGNEARMNYPGKTGGWWQWRYTPEMLDETIAYRLRELTELYGRAEEPSDTGEEE